MACYGTTSEQFGAVAVAQRAWAAGNPRAQLRDLLTIDDHQASRWIVAPLHLLDCCLVSNGSIAVVLTSADRAAGLRRPPVHLWGWGQGHPGHQMARGSEFGLRTGAAIAGPAAMAMAGIGASIVIGIAYWGVQPLFEKVGDVGLLPPAMAAWSPDLLFSLTGMYLLLRMKS